MLSESIVQPWIPIFLVNLQSVFTLLLGFSGKLLLFSFLSPVLFLSPSPFFQLCRCSTKAKEIHEILYFLCYQKFIHTLIHIYYKGVELGLG